MSSVAEREQPKTDRGLLDAGKKLVDKAKQKSFEVGLSQGLNLLAKAPEDKYVFIVDNILARFADSPQKKMTVDFLREYLSPGHPGSAYIKRVLSTLHPNVRKTYLAKFISSLLFRDPVLEAQINKTKEEIGADPKLMVISPTARCNLKCIGCYAGNYEQNQGMEPDLVQRIIDEAKELGIRFFVISGGEPLMYKPLLSLLEKNHDCVFQLYTNGTLIDKPMAKELVRLGNACPCISVEGFAEETDGRRGRGVFSKVLEAFDNLHEAGAMYGFSATGTRKNYKIITSDEFIDLMVEKGVHYGWYFQFMPVGRDAGLEELFLRPEERSEFRERIMSFRTRKPMLAGDFWNDGGLTNGCLAGGRHYLHINSEGWIEPCVFTHFATDNIRDVTLKQALNSPFFHALRDGIEYEYSCNRNLLRPCTIIDHPNVLRDAVIECGARPTHEGADAVVSDFANDLDAYAEEMEKVTGPVWKKDYTWTKVWHGWEDKE
ncbi:MAG: radical SAM protein [Chloroflexi bacterium]|nr:radical SAM protein [Chloroflexota bacterium]